MGVEISFSPHCAASRCPSGVHSWLITEGERGGEGDEGDEGKRHSWGVALSDRGGVKVVVMVVDWGGVQGVKEDSRGADGQGWGALLLCRMGGVGGV